MTLIKNFDPNFSGELKNGLHADSTPHSTPKDLPESEKEYKAHPYLIVGSGRLSRHLQYYFSQLEIPFSTWSRKQEIKELETLLEKRPVVLLALSDHALTSFYDLHLEKHRLNVVHFSGAFHHSQMHSCHPLMTFSHDLFPLNTYKSIHFAVTGISSLQEIIPELPNVSFQLNAADKANYHAWCVLTAAGTQTIWKAAQDRFRSLGIPDDAFLLYAKQVTENFLKDPDKSLTGPWVRNDESTIEKNLQALSSTPERQLYELLRKGLL